MLDAFKDILNMEDVRGIILFSDEGKLIFKHFVTPLPEEPEKRDWWKLFIASLNGVREADLVFERSRIYIRKADIGYLLVLMGVFAPVAMVRLNCDMALPSLRQSEAKKGFRRIFGKR
jgi:hypothetical protein